MNYLFNLNWDDLEFDEIMMCDRNLKIVEGDVISEKNFCLFMNDCVYVFEERMRGGFEYCLENNIFNIYRK